MKFQYFNSSEIKYALLPPSSNLEKTRRKSQKSRVKLAHQPLTNLNLESIDIVRMSNLLSQESLSGRILFAIPKKGRLYEKCLELLQGADVIFKRQHRLDVALVQNHPMAL